MVDIFSIFLLELKFYFQDRFQKPSLTKWIFFANFRNESPNQIKNSNSLKKKKKKKKD